MIDLGQKSMKYLGTNVNFAFRDIRSRLVVKSDQLFS